MFDSPPNSSTPKPETPSPPASSPEKPKTFSNWKTIWPTRFASVPRPANISTVPVYTTSGTGYVPRSPNAPAVPATTPAYVPQNGNMLQPLNAAVYNDTQQYGVPAYYYSPVYTPSYLDCYPYTYAAPTYAYPYYPLYPVTIFAGFNGFHHFNHGFGSGISFHGGGFSGSFGHGGFGHGSHH